MLDGRGPMQNAMAEAPCRMPRIVAPEVLNKPKEVWRTSSLLQSEIDNGKPPLCLLKGALRLLSCTHASVNSFTRWCQWLQRGTQWVLVLRVLLVLGSFLFPQEQIKAKMMIALVSMASRDSVDSLLHSR